MKIPTISISILFQDEDLYYEIWNIHSNKVWVLKLKFQKSIKISYLCLNLKFKFQKNCKRVKSF